MSLYRDEGVVLRTMRLGEADRIVTMLCRTHGKVRAVAKGCARPPRASAAGSSP
jgi:DNA repair protein RecO (recombination protein O)